MMAGWMGRLATYRSVRWQGAGGRRAADEAVSGWEDAYLD